MVKYCCSNYPSENEKDYESFYSSYSYKLHDFQKWCVEATVTGNHVLVTAPTGTGKTFGGEFALNYFHGKGKKTIYTSPIKALSNEKFHNFTLKYPHISIGLITGDIKTNPDADVLIMTTEILLNKLYQIHSTTPVPKSSISFDMDIQNELACVIFDEVHMINDESRGHVWEQSIMMLPPHVQMVCLSATLASPEAFALWLETKGDTTKTPTKEVYLTKKTVRAVPLLHHVFLASNESVFKRIKDKQQQEEIRNMTNKLVLIQGNNNVFDETTYSKASSILKLYEKNEIIIRRQHVLNKVAEHLVQNNLLPALCYVFSRKKLEQCAEEMTANLLEFDSKVPYIIDRECEQIIRKLPNYAEYLHLPEYNNMVKLLRKGVGIHHAGLMPILREMVELLFAKGYIKMLFCTETMSVGINLPVKTTIFTDVNKFNGEITRTLYSHEYTQAAGRAGRLGLDTVGNVVHLNNLFRNVDSVSYKQMLSGKPQTLVSKFKISYSLLLNLIDIGDKKLVDFVKKSMITNDLEGHLKEIQMKKEQIIAEVERMNSCLKYLKTPHNIIENYIELVSSKNSAINKKKREIERSIQNLKDEYKTIDNDMLSYVRVDDKKKELVKLESEYESVTNYTNSSVSNVLQLLREENFVDMANEDIKLTPKGMLASQLKELHCLVFANLIEMKKIDKLNTEELICLFSCFTNINVEDDKKVYELSKEMDVALYETIEEVKHMYDDYQRKENMRYIHSGIDYNIHYDLIEYVNRWSYTESIEDCKLILQEIENEKGIFLGEFVKSILKINNISCEFEKIAEMMGNIEFLSRLKEIPHKTLKYVVTNQSLYV